VLCSPDLLNMQIAADDQHVTRDKAYRICHCCHSPPVKCVETEHGAIAIQFRPQRFGHS
jgi:hypothetical protein